MENSMVKWSKPAYLEIENQSNTMAVTNKCIISPYMCTASPGNYQGEASITRSNLAATGNGMQGTVHSKWHYFHSHGGDGRAEKDAMMNVPCSIPVICFPQKHPGHWRG